MSLMLLERKGAHSSSQHASCMNWCMTVIMLWSWFGSWTKLLHTFPADREEKDLVFGCYATTQSDHMRTNVHVRISWLLFISVVCYQTLQQHVVDVHIWVQFSFLKHKWVSHWSTSGHQAQNCALVLIFRKWYEIPIKQAYHRFPQKTY